MTSIRYPRITLLALLALVALVAAACQNGDATSPSASQAETSQAPASVEASEPESSEPQSTEPTTAASGGAAGEETSVFDLETGDCFTADSTTLNTVLVVDCQETHVYEVYDVGDIGAAEDAYPGNEAVEQAATDQCQSAFEPYVGIGYQESVWYVTTVPPNESTWAEGDREVLCLLHNQDETEVTGSAEGSGE